MSSRRELLNLLGLPTKYLSHTLVNIENLQHFLLQQKGDGLYHYFFYIVLEIPVCSLKQVKYITIVCRLDKEETEQSLLIVDM